MARLPRYQESGLISADIPRLDFANLREQAKLTESVSSALDRLSQFAFGRVAEQRRQQNQMLAIQLRADLELETQKKLGEIRINIDQNKYQDLGSVQSDLQGIGIGNAKQIAQLDPAQANSYLQSFSSASAGMMNRAADQFVKQGQAVANQRFASSLPLMERQISTIVENSKDFLEMHINIRDMQDKVEAFAATNGMDVNKAFGDFQSIVESGVTSTIASYLTGTDYASNSAEAFAKLRKGDLGKFENHWKNLGQQTKDKIQKQMLEGFAAQEQSIRIEDQNRKRQNEREYVNKYASWISETNPARKAGIGQELIRLSTSTADIDRVLKNENDDNPLLHSQLKQDISFGLINTVEQLHSYIRRGGISKGQLNELHNLILSQDKASIGRQYKRINAMAGVPDGGVQSLFNPQDARVKKRETLVRMFDAALEEERGKMAAKPDAERTGINFDAITDRVLKEYENNRPKVNQSSPDINALIRMQEKAKKAGKEVVLIENDVVKENISIEDLKQLRSGLLGMSRVYSDADIRLIDSIIKRSTQ